MPKTNQSKILIIYTGGTIGMITDVETGSLKPFDFNQITEEVPELKKVPYHLETLSFDEPIDSSNVTPVEWIKVANLIEENYKPNQSLHSIKEVKLNYHLQVRK